MLIQHKRREIKVKEKLGKADVLICLVGKSAMPNMIGIATRAKRDAKIYLMATKDTVNIANNIKTILRNKSSALNIETVELEEYENPEKVYCEIEHKLERIKKEYEACTRKNKMIELNYTGGTKIVSSLSYALFLKMFDQYKESMYLTYLDGEQSEALINYNGKEYKLPYSRELDEFNLDLQDILSVYDDMDISKNTSKNLEEIDVPPFGKEMLQFIIENLDKRGLIIEYLEYLMKNLKDKKVQEAKNILDNVNSQYPDVLPQYTDHNSYFKSMELTEDVPQKEKKSRINTRLGNGFWFEDAMVPILKSLVNEGVIDQCIYNFKSKINNDTIMEIDFIVMKDLKLYFISVSTVDRPEESKLKLYEVNQRAKTLADNEACVCTVTFVENRNVIENEFKDIWQDDLTNTLLITWKELPEIKERIKQWINNKGVLCENEK